MLMGKKDDERSFDRMKRSSDRTGVVNKLIWYLDSRGKIFLELREYEKAYMSFTKALSIPFNAGAMGEGENGEADAALRDSFSKCILLNKVMQMRNGASILEGSSCGQRSVLNFEHLLHFTSKFTL